MLGILSSYAVDDHKSYTLTSSHPTCLWTYTSLQYVPFGVAHDVHLHNEDIPLDSILYKYGNLQTHDRIHSAGPSAIQPRKFLCFSANKSSRERRMTSRTEKLTAWFTITHTFNFTTNLTVILWHHLLNLMRNRRFFSWTCIILLAFAISAKSRSRDSYSYGALCLRYAKSSPICLSSFLWTIILTTFCSSAHAQSCEDYHGQPQRCWHRYHCQMSMSYYTSGNDMSLRKIHLPLSVKPHIVHMEWFWSQIKRIVRLMLYHYIHANILHFTIRTCLRHNFVFTTDRTNCHYLLSLQPLGSNDSLRPWPAFHSFFTNDCFLAFLPFFERLPFLSQRGVWIPFNIWLSVIVSTSAFLRQDYAHVQQDAMVHSLCRSGQHIANKQRVLPLHDN